MLKQESRSKEVQAWEDKKGNPKKLISYKQSHRQQKQLRTLSQVYGKAPTSDISALRFLEDFWE